MRVLSADVVVVGGGAAGCYAALNLHRKGIKAIIVCKGLVGKSGASIFAGNLVISGRGLGNTEEQARNTAEFLIKYHNQFLIDQHWARACGQWIENVYYPELEEAGLYFRRDDEGNVVTSPGEDPQRRGEHARQFRRAVHGPAAQAGHQGRHPALGGDCRHRAAAQIRRLGVRRVCAQCHHRRISGRARPRRDSRHRIFRPAACALDRHARDVGRRHRDGVARRRAMANLEMQWWHTNDIADPPSWQRMQVYPNPMLGSEKSARMVNSAGEEFFNQQQDDPLAYGPYTVQLKALAKQVHAGKARYDGGYYAGFDHCDAR